MVRRDRGVINIILKRAYDGAVSRNRLQERGRRRRAVSRLAIVGPTWDGGDITLGYNWYNISPTRGISAPIHLRLQPLGPGQRNPLGSPYRARSPPAHQPIQRPIGQFLSCAANGHIVQCFASQPRRRPVHPIIMASVRSAPFRLRLWNWTAFEYCGPIGTNGTRTIQPLFDHLLQLGRTNITAPRCGRSAATKNISSTAKPLRPSPHQLRQQHPPPTNSSSGADLHPYTDGQRTDQSACQLQHVHRSPSQTAPMEWFALIRAG